MSQNQPDGMIPAVRLNGNYDITNVVDIYENKDRIIKTLNTCKNLLLKHAGPYSQYSMIVKRDGGFAEFTRDGISILNNLQFFSPLENHIKNLLAHVGTLVDNSAKDNTTTSILVAAEFVSTALKSGYLEQAVKERKTPKDVKKIFDKITNLITFILRMNPYSIADGWAMLIQSANPTMTARVARNKAAGLIAFSQAMSSSGGDIELAKKLKLVFEQCPDICREYMTYQGTAIETKEEFIVRENEYDAKIECTTALPAQYSFNNAIGTEYHDTATFIVIPDAISDLSVAENDLCSYIETHKDENIAIMAMRFSNAVMRSAIAAQGRVTLWQYAARVVNGGQTSISELLIVKAIAKPGIRTEEFNAIQNVDVKWSDGKLFLGNYYPECTDKDNARVHPYYLEYTSCTTEEAKEKLPVEVKEYGAMLDELTSALKAYHDGRKLDGTAEGLYINLLEKLTACHKLVLHVGGTSYTAIANQSVIKDALGAIMSSLKDGMNPRGLISIAKALQEIKSNGFNGVDDSESTKILFNALFSGIMTVINSVYSVENVDEIACDNVLYNEGTSPDKIEANTDLVENIISKADDSNLDNFVYDYPIVQPLKAVEEMFNRMSDLLTKVLCTSEMIVDNSFMTKDDN